MGYTLTTTDGGGVSTSTGSLGSSGGSGGSGASGAASSAGAAYTLYSMNKGGGDKKTSAASGAIAGAQLGSNFGPWGTVIGAVVGGIYGAVVGGRETIAQKQQKRMKALLDANTIGFKEFVMATMKGAQDPRRQQIYAEAPEGFVGFGDENTFMNKKFAQSRSEADLTPYDVWGGMGLFETFGDDWLGTYNEQQRYDISQALLDNNIIVEREGGIHIDNKEEAQRIKDEVIAGTYKPPEFTQNRQTDESGRLAVGEDGQFITPSISDPQAAVPQYRPMVEAKDGSGRLVPATPVEGQEDLPQNLVGSSDSAPGVAAIDQPNVAVQGQAAPEPQGPLVQVGDGSGRLVRQPPKQKLPKNLTGEQSESQPSGYLNPLDEPGFLYKPQSEGGGLVILLPSQYKNSQVTLKDQQGNVLEQGRSSGYANGDREHFRFGKSGENYGDNLIAEVTLSDGTVKQYSIAKGGERYDSAGGTGGGGGADTATLPYLLSAAAGPSNVSHYSSGISDNLANQAGATFSSGGQQQGNSLAQFDEALQRIMAS